MRSRHLFGIMLAGLTALAGGSSGCDKETAPVGEGGGGGQGGEGGGGSMAVDNDGNTSCDTAVAYVLGAAEDVASKLDPVSVDRDYYKVDLKKGQAILLNANSKPDTDPYGESFPDAVVTLFGPDGKTQIAQNDDGGSSNNSELLYIVPEDGTYCVEVSECYVLFGADVCSPPEGITNFDYTFGGFELNPASPVTSVDAEPNDTAATATPMNLFPFPEPPEAPAVYQTYAWGGFSGLGDQDIFSFTAQNDFTVDPGARPLCIFTFYPAGIEGNGSTADANVLAQVSTKAAPNTIIAQADVHLGDFTFGYAELPTISMPCIKGTDYLFTLSRMDGATVGTNDFYFFDHLQGGSNAIEVEPNDSNPQAIPLTKTDDGNYVASISGDLLKAGAGGEVDMFQVEVPAGMGLATALCSAERDGSGLRGLQVSLLDSNDGFLKNGSGSEGPDHILFIDSALITAGSTAVKMKLIADAQDPNVTSKYYYCTLLLTPQ